MVKFWLGGPDPLDYISMYSNQGEGDDGQHWHYISCGLSGTVPYRVSYIIHSRAERNRDFSVPQRNNDDSAIVGEIFVLRAITGFFSFAESYKVYV
jgi:hypothetical protein